MPWRRARVCSQGQLRRADSNNSRELGRRPLPDGYGFLIILATCLAGSTFERMSVEPLFERV
jgi:hypothetical protein